MNLADVLTGIRDGDRHRGGIRCRRLLRLEPDAFSALRDEVLAWCRDRAPSVVTRPEHVTHWTRPFGEVLQHSLLNASGRSDDYTHDHDQSCRGKRFHAAAEHPALARFIAALPHTVNVRINVLGPGGQ